MTPSTTTLIILAVFVCIALLLFGGWFALRFSGRTALSTPEQEGAAALEKGLAFLLDDSSDDKAIAAATKRKTSRAATRTQVLAELAAKVSPSGSAPASQTPTVKS